MKIQPMNVRFVTHVGSKIYPDKESFFDYIKILENESDEKTILRIDFTNDKTKEKIIKLKKLLTLKSYEKEKQYSFYDLSNVDLEKIVETLNFLIKSITL